MAILNPLREFVITGIKTLMFYDTQGDMIGEIDKLTDINISDETASSELRGGLNNPVILKIYGDRTCRLSATNSTISMDMLKIMTGNTVVTKTVNVPKTAKKLSIASNSVTLPVAPSAGTNVTVYLSNANAENIQKLSKVASAPTAGQFSITGTTITLASGTTGVVNVYYFVSEESEVIEALAGAFPVYQAKGICLLTSTTNGKLYRGVIDLPACQLSPTVSIAGKNSSDAPDGNALELDLLSTSTYPYAIQAQEITDKALL